MPDSGTTPVDPSSQATATLLAHQLSLLLTALLQASRATSDSTRLMQIANEMTGVQTLISQVAQAQAAADDVAFAQATAGLTSEATVLTGMETQITKIVADVGLAGQIVGYVVQALALVAKL
jgi:hypothetical protein